MGHNDSWLATEEAQIVGTVGLLPVANMMADTESKNANTSVRPSVTLVIHA